MPIFDVKLVLKSSLMNIHPETMANFCAVWRQDQHTFFVAKGAHQKVGDISIQKYFKK
jgi:hypothetical protein